MSCEDLNGSNISDERSIFTEQLDIYKAQHLLRDKISSRPNRQYLIQQHILNDTHVAPSLQVYEQSLKRARLADNLNVKLLKRPGPLELVEYNILQTSPILKEALKDGLIPYKRTSSDVYSSSFAIPPTDFNFGLSFGGQSSIEKHYEGRETSLGDVERESFLTDTCHIGHVHSSPVRLDPLTEHTLKNTEHVVYEDQSRLVDTLQPNLDNVNLDITDFFDEEINNRQDKLKEFYAKKSISSRSKSDSQNIDIEKERLAITHELIYATTQLLEDTDFTQHPYNCKFPSQNAVHSNICSSYSNTNSVSRNIEEEIQPSIESAYPMQIGNLNEIPIDEEFPLLSVMDKMNGSQNGKLKTLFTQRTLPSNDKSEKVFEGRQTINNKFISLLGVKKRRNRKSQTQSCSDRKIQQNSETLELQNRSDSIDLSTNTNVADKNVVNKVKNQERCQPRSLIFHEYNGPPLVKCTNQTYNDQTSLSITYADTLSSASRHEQDISSVGNFSNENLTRCLPAGNKRRNKQNNTHNRFTKDHSKNVQNVDKSNHSVTNMGKADTTSNSYKILLHQQKIFLQLLQKFQFSADLAASLMSTSNIDCRAKNIDRSTTGRCTHSLLFNDPSSNKNVDVECTDDLSLSCSDVLSALKQLRVADLKEHCRQRGLLVGGNKNDLIERILTENALNCRDDHNALSRQVHNYDENSIDDTQMNNKQCLNEVTGTQKSYSGKEKHLIHKHISNNDNEYETNFKLASYYPAHHSLNANSYPVLISTNTPEVTLRCASSNDRQVDAFRIN